MTVKELYGEEYTDYYLKKIYDIYYTYYDSMDIEFSNKRDSEKFNDMINTDFIQRSLQIIADYYIQKNEDEQC
jgi:hypothetical protein